MLGTNIREYRKNKKLTIKELAERTGLSIGDISQVEREEAEPSLSSLRKIAREFDVPGIPKFPLSIIPRKPFW